VFRYQVEGNDADERRIAAAVGAAGLVVIAGEVDAEIEDVPIVAVMVAEPDATRLEGWKVVDVVPKPDVTPLVGLRL